MQESKGINVNALDSSAGFDAQTSGMFQFSVRVLPAGILFLRQPYLNWPSSARIVAAVAQRDLRGRKSHLGRDFCRSTVTENGRDFVTWRQF